MKEDKRAPVMILCTNGACHKYCMYSITFWICIVSATVSNTGKTAEKLDSQETWIHVRRKVEKNHGL